MSEVVELNIKAKQYIKPTATKYSTLTYFTAGKVKPPPPPEQIAQHKAAIAEWITKANAMEAAYKGTAW